MGPGVFLKDSFHREGKAHWADCPWIIIYKAVLWRVGDKVLQLKKNDYKLKEAKKEREKRKRMEWREGGEKEDGKEED